MAEEIVAGPGPKPKPTAPPKLTQDIYPELTTFSISPRTQQAMRARGLNPTQEIQRLEAAHKNKDYQTKAEIANRLAYFNDSVEGGNASLNYLDSFRLPTQEEATPRYNSVSTRQAIGGTIYNGFVDMVEGAAKLPVIAAGLNRMIDPAAFTKANKAIENTFNGLKAYVSQDWQKPAVSYSDENGLQFDLSFKPIVGTLSSAATYILPGLMTGGAASIATMGERAALKAATTGAERALLTKTLAKAGQTATYLTGAEAFLQTYPLYQREAQASGLDIYDSTLYGLIVGGINSAIETASMGPLTKALGITEKTAKTTIRQVGLQEATDALQKLAQKELTSDLLLEAAQTATKNTLGVIANPQQLSAAAKLVAGVGSRIKNGFLTQGLPEAGEEFLQSIVENSSKQLYNNFLASDTTGRFQDPSLGKYAFDALYGASLGALIGSVPGSFLHTRQADPTVFGYVAANVRNGLQKNLKLSDMISDDPATPGRLKMLGVLDQKLATEQITPEEHADLTGKVYRMASMAADFADVDTFSEKDRHTMFSLGEAKFQADQSATQIQSLKNDYEQLGQLRQDPNLSIGEQLKAELRQGEIQRQLGQIVDTPTGSLFEAEYRQQQRAEAIAGIKAQAMRQYANDETRPSINQFVTDNLERINRDFGVISYPDDFKPSKIISDPASGQTYVTNSNKLIFRNLTRSGGEVITPASIDENGIYTPAIRSEVVDSYEQPVADLNTHIGLSTALDDRNNPLEAQDYRRPDNSVEANWILDGQQIVQDLQTIQGSKAKGKRAALAEAQKTALAYLNSSSFLLDDPKYSSPYSEIVQALQPAVGELLAQQEQNAVPAGGDVSLLEDVPTQQELADQEWAANVLDNLPPADGRPVDLTNQIQNDTQTPTTQPTAFPIPARLGTPTEQSPASFDDYSATILAADIEEQRQSAGDQLQQATESLTDAVRETIRGTNGADERLLQELERANAALEQELANYATPVEQQPANESLSSAGRTQTLASIWQDSLSPEDQTQAANLASEYLSVENGNNFDEITRRIIDNPPVIQNLREAYSRINGQSFWRPIMQAKYGAKAGDSISPTLDQYAQSLSDEGITITEQDVLDFITQYPQGIDQVYTQARQGIRDQFRALTGKEINKLSAQNVVAWANALEQPQTSGVEEVTDDDLSEAKRVVDSLSEEDQAYLGTMIAQYQQMYGDDWAMQLHGDDRSNKLLVELPESFSRLLTNVVSSAIFDNNQQALANVRDYLQSRLLPTAFESVPEGRPNGISDGFIDRQPQEAAEYSGGRERPAATTLESATQSILGQTESTEETTELDGVIDSLDAEVESQINQQLAVPVAAPFDSDGKTTYFARVADVPNGFLASSFTAMPTRTPLYEMMPINDSEAEYRLVPTEAARQLAMTDPYSYLDAVEGYGSLDPNDVFITVKNGRLAKQGDRWIITEKAKVVNVAPEQIPTFQLPVQSVESSSVQPEVQVFADRLASAFGITIVTDPNAYSQALADSRALERTNGREPVAFRWKGVVYLSGNADTGSIIHEAAGIWAEGIRKSAPELYNRGVELVKQSRYYQQLLRDPYYRTLSQRELEIEALETAIGDQGAQFVTEGRKSSFRQFLSDLWNKVKQILGLSPDTDLSNMTLSDFVRTAVGDILSGSTQSSTNDGIQFQLPNSTLQSLVTKFGITPTGFADLKQTAQSWLENTKANPAIKSPLGIDADLWNKAGKYNLLEQEYINSVAAQTGFKLISAGTLEYTRPNTLYHLPNGQVAIIDKSQIASVVEEVFGKLYNDTTHRGRLYKFVTDYLKPWINSTTFSELIDDKQGSLSTLIREIQLESARNANVVKNLLQDKRDTAERLLAKFDESTIAVQSYDYDVNGNVELVQKTIPLTTAMEMVALGETQLATYKKASHVFDAAPKPNELYEQTRSGLLRKEDHGAQVYDQVNDRIDTIFLPRAEFDSLLDRFTTDNGAAAGESEAYTALKDFFNQEKAASALENESVSLNPDEDFVREQVYYPIRTAKGDSNARMERQGSLKLYDENGRLKNRRGVPKGIVVGNPVQTMRSYESTVGDILEYAKVTENLEHIKDAIADNYRGPQRETLTRFLSQRISDLKTHRDKVRQAREDSPGIAMLERGMKRYTTSIFALNIGLPAKQIGSAMAALGQGIIDNQHLLDTRALSVLAKLTAGAYRDATVTANVRADGSDEGLSGGLLTQGDTLERPYLDEMLGNGLPDTEREKQQRRFASVINRMLDNRNQYVGDVQFEDLGLNEKTLTDAQKAIKKYDQFASDRLMSATRRADRAPVLYYYEAAKLQSQAEGLSGDAYWDRVADLTERVMSETYNLDNILERTPTQLSTNFFLKVIGMYSSQQQKIANLLIKSMITYARAEPGTPEAMAARSRLLHTLGYGVIANAVYVSAVSAAASVLLALLSGDEPKDTEDLIAGIGYDSVRNVVGTFPGVGSLAAEYFINANDNIMGNEDMVDVTALNNIKTGIDAIIAAGDYMTAEDEQKSDKAADTFVNKSTDFVGKNLGLPTTAIRLLREWSTTDKDDIDN